MFTDGPLTLELKCNRCEQSARYDVGTALMHPAPALTGAPAWDGFTFTRVIVCNFCGAEDDYALSSRARLALLVEIAATKIGVVTGEWGSPGGPRVHVGAAGLDDGTEIRRASDGLRHWRNRLERSPDDADAWMHLGNMCRRGGKTDEAIQAFRRVMTLCPGDIEPASILLATLLENGRGNDGADLPAYILKGLPFTRDEVIRHEAGGPVAEFLRQTVAAGQALALSGIWMAPNVGDQMIATSSSIDLRRVTRWDRLAEFIGHPAVRRFGLQIAGPGDADTILERLIEDEGPMDAAFSPGEAESGPFDGLPTQPIVRITPKVGRNDPCTCGSGRKYKRCHGA